MEANQPILKTPRKKKTKLESVEEKHKKMIRRRLKFCNSGESVITQSCIHQLKNGYILSLRQFQKSKSNRTVGELLLKSLTLPSFINHLNTVTDKMETPEIIIDE